jgi:hypothetical protein
MSLIQQRHAIDRKRVIGIAVTAIGGLGVLAGTFTLMGFPFRPINVWLLVIWVVYLATGIQSLIVARRRRIAFEAENGVDAGKQDPIR